MGLPDLQRPARELVMQRCWFAMFVLATFVLATVAPQVVRASCPSGAIDGAVAVQVTEAAVDTLKAQAFAMVPTEIALPETAIAIAECSDLTQATILPRHGTLSVGIVSGDVEFNQGSMHLAGEINLAMSAGLDMDLCGFALTTCEATLDAQSVTFAADVAIGAVDCVPTVTLSNVEVTLDPYDIEVGLTGCGLWSDAADLIYSAYEALILDIMQDKIHEVLQEELPAMLDTFSGSLTALQLEALDTNIEVALSHVNVVPGALQAKLAIAIAPTAGPGACLPPGVTLPQVPAQALDVLWTLGAPVSAVVSQSLAQQVVNVLWYNGTMCLDSGSLGLDLSSYLGEIAPGVDVSATLSPNTAPTIVFAADGASRRVRVDVADVEATIDISAADGPPTTAVVRFDASLSGDARVDGQTGNLLVDFIDADLTHLEVITVGGDLSFSEAQLSAVVDTLLLPALRDDLSPLALSGSFVVGESTAVRVQNLYADALSLRIDLDLWAVDMTDTVPPQTILVDAAPALSSSRLELLFESIDDRTPIPFMRHRVTLDGVTEETERSGQQLIFTMLEAGTHAMEIAALDVTGNVDLTPVSFTFLVDDEAPEVTITDAPYGFLDGSSAHFEFDATDDHAASSEIRYRYTVGLVSKLPGSDELVQHGELGQRRFLDVRNLPEDRVVRVTIFALDAAGNEGQAEASFAVNQNATLGCQAGAGGLSWLAVVLLPALHVRRRRGSSVR